MRVLDLGCGTGWPLERMGVSESDFITGVDINADRLNVARQRFPNRVYLKAKGESLPLRDNSFDRVFCALALPYMDIPRALAEINRVLASEGTIFLSLHSVGFTLKELLQHALPHPVPTLFRLYVLANGIIFHYTGNLLRFSKRRIESFQTKRGIVTALSRLGFTDVGFRDLDGRFVVEAKKL
jgi:ubiquinone/menaquinone biosynthesis C-methylase UbiE